MTPPKFSSQSEHSIQTYRIQQSPNYKFFVPLSFVYSNYAQTSKTMSENKEIPLAHSRTHLRTQRYTYHKVENLNIVVYVITLLNKGMT